MSLWFVSSIEEAKLKFNEQRKNDNKEPATVHGEMKFSKDDLDGVGFELKQEGDPLHFNAYFHEEGNMKAAECANSPEAMKTKVKGEKVFTTVAKILFDKCKKAGKVVLCE